jgi:ribosomal protein S18 acetylase RimI-like enzyme
MKQKMKFKIEKANSKDVDAIVNLEMMLTDEMVILDPKNVKIKPRAELEKGCHNWIRSSIKKKNWLILKAVADEKIVGFLAGELREGVPIYKNKLVGEINDIYILPKYRRKGVCSALISECKNWLKNKKADEMTIELLSLNLPAIKSYEKCGFVEYRKKMKKFVNNI